MWGNFDGSHANKEASHTDDVSMTPLARHSRKGKTTGTDPMSLAVRATTAGESGARWDSFCLGVEMLP